MKTSKNYYKLKIKGHKYVEMKKADNILPFKWIGKGESHNGSVEKK